MKTSWGVLEVPELQYAGGRLPCMIVTEEERTTCYRIVDGTLTHGALRFHINYDEKAGAKAAKRYGRDKLEMPSISSILDLAPFMMDNAKTILQKDRNHGWFVFFFKGTTRVHEETLYARDQADKYILARRLADVVRTTEADGVISVGDTWLAPFAVDAAGFPIRPAQSPERQEALIIHAETSDGRARQLVTPYTRRFRRIRFEDAMEVFDSEAREYNLLEPIRKVWQTWQSSGPKEAESKRTDRCG